MIQAIAIDDEPLALKVITSLIGRMEGITLVKTFTQPNEGLSYLKKFPVDLVFLDIHMPAISGMSLAKQLPENIMVIFTTAFSEYAVNSYELDAIDYLVKPINLPRLQKAVDKAIDYKNLTGKASNTASRSIFIRADLSLVKVNLDEVLYIEGLANYVQIQLLGKKPIISRLTMKQILEKLPDGEFLRVHRSFIVPIQRVTAVRLGMIYLQEKTIPVGRTYLEDVNTRWKQ
jgi:DNA-binding LytR/AlgR family response regulator